MKEIDKKSLFILIPVIFFLVALIIAFGAPKSEVGPRVIGGIFFFTYGLYNIYGVVFNGHVTGHGYDSRSEKDDPYKLRKLYGTGGIVMTNKNKNLHSLSSFGRANSARPFYGRYA